MNKLISLLTALIITLGSVPCIADEYDVPPVEVDDVLSPSEKPDSEDVKEDPKQEDKNEDATKDTDSTKNETKNADNTEKSNTTVTDKSNSDYNADDILKNFTSKNFKMEIYSKCKNYELDVRLKNSDISSKRDSQKNELADFIEAVEYAMNTYGTKNTYRASGDLKKAYEASDDGIYICMYYSSSEKYELFISENQAVTWFGSFKLDDKYVNDFASFLKRSTAGNPTSALYNFIWDEDETEEHGFFDFKNKTYQYSSGKQISYVDAEKIEFDVTVDDDLGSSIFADIGNMGGTVHCTLENLLSNYNYFILTLSGRNGKKQYAVCVTDYGWQSGYKMHFLTNEYIENGKYISDDGSDMDYIYVIGRINKQSDLEIAVQYNTMNNNGKPRKTVSFDNATMAANVKYQYLLKGKDAERCRLVLSSLYGMPETKEEYIKQQEEKNNEEKTDNQKDDNKTEDKPKDDIKETEKVKFEDVPENHWAYDDISSLAEKKIIFGYGDGRFGTNDSVTSEQVSRLLDRLFEYKTDDNAALPAKRESIIISIVKALNEDVSGADVSVINEKFNDCDTINAEDRQYIAYAIGAGLVKGYDGKLNPEDNVTRAETAALLCRALKIEK